MSEFDKFLQKSGLTFEEQILVDRIKYSCYLMPSESHRRQRDGTVVNEKDLCDIVHTSKHFEEVGE